MTSGMEEYSYMYIYFLPIHILQIFRRGEYVLRHDKEIEN